MKRNQFEEAEKKIEKVKEILISAIKRLNNKNQTQFQHQMRLLTWFEDRIRDHEIGKQYAFLLDNVDINKYDNVYDIWGYLKTTDSLKLRNGEPLPQYEYEFAMNSIEYAIDFINLIDMIHELID